MPRAPHRRQRGLRPGQPCSRMISFMRSCSGLSRIANAAKAESPWGEPSPIPRYRFGKADAVLLVLLFHSEQLLSEIQVEGGVAGFRLGHELVPPLVLAERCQCGVLLHLVHVGPSRLYDLLQILEREVVQASPRVVARGSVEGHGVAARDRVSPFEESASFFESLRFLGGGCSLKQFDKGLRLEGRRARAQQGETEEQRNEGGSGYRHGCAA